eukprot:2569103-Lingulodinium_polyedra.AAC.1
MNAAGQNRKRLAQTTLGPPPSTSMSARISRKNAARRERRTLGVWVGNVKPIKRLRDARDT